MRTDECRRPWHCVNHEYSDFGLMSDLYCPQCRVKYKTAWTDPVEGSTVVYRYLECPACGRRLRETREVEVLVAGGVAEAV